MPRGSYNINNGYYGTGGASSIGGGAAKGGSYSAVPLSDVSQPPRPANSSSYSSCLMALLFFLAMCIIISLAAWPWGGGKQQTPYPNNGTKKGVHDGYHGDYRSTTEQPHQRMNHNPLKQNTTTQHITPSTSTETPISTKKSLPSTKAPPSTITTASPTETTTLTTTPRPLGPPIEAEDPGNFNDVNAERPIEGDHRSNETEDVVSKRNASESSSTKKSERILMPSGGEGPLSNTTTRGATLSPTTSSTTLNNNSSTTPNPPHPSTKNDSLDSSSTSVAPSEKRPFNGTDSHNGTHVEGRLHLTTEIPTTTRDSHAGDGLYLKSETTKPTTTDPPTSTKTPTFTENPAKKPITTKANTTTEIPTTIKTPITTEAPTTTKTPTTTETPVKKLITAKAPIITEKPTTTEAPTTTKIPTITETPAKKPIITKANTTTEIPTTTKTPITTKAPTTTKTPTTTETPAKKPITTKTPTTIKIPVTTENPATTEIPTTTKTPTTIKIPVTSENPATTEIPSTTNTITETPMTAKIPNIIKTNTTTKTPTTIETPTTIGIPTTIKTPITTENPTTTKTPTIIETLTTTTKPTTTKIPTTTETHTTTKTPIITKKPTTTKIPTTTETHTTTKTPIITKKPTTTETPTTIPATTKIPITTSTTTETPRIYKEKERDLPEENKRTKRSACETPVCKSLSSRMLSLMDHTSEPCEDFYSYACGGMLAKGNQWISEVSPESEPKSRIKEMMKKINESSPISLQKFDNFYASCLTYKDVLMNERIEKAREILSRVGKMYTVSEPSPDGNQVFNLLLGNLLKYHFSPFMDLLLEIETGRSSKFVLKLTIPEHQSPFDKPNGRDKQATLRGWPKETCLKEATANGRESYGELNFNSIYNKYTLCNSDLSEYMQEVKMMLQTLKLFGSTDDDAHIKQVTSELQKMLEMIIKKLPSPAERKKAILERDYIDNDIEELQGAYPVVPWKHLLNNLLGSEIPEDTNVQVYFQSYFTDIFNEMETMDLRDLNNILLAMFAHELYYGLVLNRNSCFREDHCFTVSEQLMKDATSALFLRSFRPQELNDFQAKINSTFRELTSILETEVKNISWMEDLSKNSAIGKIQNMKLIADGGISFFLDDEYLNSQFKEYPLNSTYLENAVSLLQRYRKMMYQSYNKDPSESELIWTHFLLPYSTKGLPIYSLNAIVVPYGIMYQPFFSKDYPEYVQMAGFGQWIAQLIWHHFDKKGVYFSMDGTATNLLTSQSMHSLLEVANCLENQDISIKRPRDGKTIQYKLSSSISTNFRLADIGATHLAYSLIWNNETIRDDLEPLPWSNMSPQKLYFLSLAQSHCTRASLHDFAVSISEEGDPSPFTRISDIATNSREFAEAFSCPKAPSEHDHDTCEPFTLASAAQPADVNLDPE